MCPAIRVIVQPAFNPVEISTRSEAVNILRVPAMARPSQPPTDRTSQTRRCFDAMTSPGQADVIPNRPGPGD